MALRDGLDKVLEECRDKAKRGQLSALMAHLDLLSIYMENDAQIDPRGGALQRQNKRYYERGRRVHTLFDRVKQDLIGLLPEYTNEIRKESEAVFVGRDFPAFPGWEEDILKFLEYGLGLVKATYQ